SPRLGLPSTARRWRRAAGRGRSLRRTRLALAAGGNQLVLELTDLIFGARPKNGATRQMRRAALERLAPRATNGVEQTSIPERLRRRGMARQRQCQPTAGSLTTVRLQFLTTDRPKNERAT